MEKEKRCVELIYQSWESLKSAHDDLDKSKLKLEHAEMEIEAAMFLMECDLSQKYQ